MRSSHAWTGTLGAWINWSYCEGRLTVTQSNEKQDLCPACNNPIDAELVGLNYIEETEEYRYTCCNLRVIVKMETKRVRRGWSYGVSFLD